MNKTWLTIEEVCKLTGEKPETVRRKCKDDKYISRFTKNGKFKLYDILLTSLPQVFQQEYLRFSSRNIEVKLDSEYQDAVPWAKKQAEKYQYLIKTTNNMKHKEIVKFLSIWNKEHPDLKSSYSSIMRAKAKYYKAGLGSLVSQRGRKTHSTQLLDKYFNYYIGVYLKEGAPSAITCWASTLGYAKSIENIDLKQFPSYKTFDRRLKKSVPEETIYRARYGHDAWYKKYALYAPRDYENITAGSCWISDHAQIDVAVSYNGKPCFPWVTVFRDARTAKWLGWFLHPEAPNSDHIFQAFYYGALEYGLPDDIYLDNGKDYRSKDFAGGRPVKGEAINNVVQNSCLMKDIDVSVHFALPYNAQTKPIERDFLKIKYFLSKNMYGYRGGKITERPQILKDEIKENKLTPYDDFKVLFDDFIVNYLNKKPSKRSKILQGKSPDELWAEEFTVKRYINKDALRLFCTRTTNNVKIGRNGIRDSQLKVNYWADWMFGRKGTMVYIRRDINAYQEAWVFDAKTEQYLGKAEILESVPFLAKTDVEKSAVRKAIQRKRKESKNIKDFLKTLERPSNEEFIANLKNSLDDVEYYSNPKVNEIANTKMDQVIKAEKEKRKLITKYSTPLEAEPKIYLSEAERDRDLARKAI